MWFGGRGSCCWVVVLSLDEAYWLLSGGRESVAGVYMRVVFGCVLIESYYVLCLNLGPSCSLEGEGSLDTLELDRFLSGGGLADRENQARWEVLQREAEYSGMAIGMKGGEKEKGSRLLGVNHPPPHNISSKACNPFFVLILARIIMGSEYFWADLLGRNNSILAERGVEWYDFEVEKSVLYIREMEGFL